MQRAEAEFDLGHGREALTLFEQARAQFHDQGNRAAEASVLDRIGTTAKLMGDAAQASQALAQAVALARQIGDRATEADALTKLAEAAYHARDWPRAVSANTELLTRAQAGGDAATAAAAAGRLGDALSNTGQKRAAIDAYRRAAVLFHTTHQPGQEYLAVRRLGAALAAIEQHLDAAAAWQQAAALAHARNDLPGEAAALHGVGIARFALADYKAAGEVLSDALRLARRAGDRADEGAILMSLGNVQYFLGRSQQAVAFYQGAQDAARALGDRAMEGEAVGNLALAYSHLGQYDKAEGYFHQDIDIAHERHDPLVEAQALGNLGAMLLEQHRDREALLPLTQSRDMARSINYQRGEAVVLRNLGLAQFRTLAIPQAEATLRQAIAVQEILRARTATADRTNITLLDSQLEAYAHLQAVLLAEQQPQAALVVAEQGRARALVDLLAARRGVTPAPAPDLVMIRRVAKSTHATLVEFSFVQADSALYVYVVTPDGGSHVRRTTLDLHGGPIDPAIQALVRDTRASLGALGPQDVPAPRPGVAGRDEMLAMFYRLLIAPVADLLPADPLAPVVLIPQGPLFLLPFAALRDGAGHALIEQHTLLVAPSVQTLDLLDPSSAPALSPALVAGNPKLSPVRLDPAQDDETLLPDLPAAGREAQAVAALMGAQPLIGAAATRAAVVAAMPQAGLIHLATHGIAEDVHAQGLPGALALAADDGAGAHDDGMLTSADIMGLRLRAGLVVLSACNTGLGNISGDGVIGLSRAFLAAGAHGVVVSLWYVPDQVTAELMPEFYRALRKGNAPAAALRAAMLQARQTHPDPLEWAGFFLVGGGE